MRSVHMDPVYEREKCVSSCNQQSSHPSAAGAIKQGIKLIITFTRLHEIKFIFSDDDDETTSSCVRVKRKDTAGNFRYNSSASVSVNEFQRHEINFFHEIYEASSSKNISK